MARIFDEGEREFVAEAYIDSAEGCGTIAKAREDAIGDCLGLFHERAHIREGAMNRRRVDHDD